MKKVCWFSAGVSSFIAGWLAGDVDEWIYIELPDQHIDSERFKQDCEKFIGKPITVITAGKNVADVVRKRRFLNSPYGAACTGVLKKEVREAWEKTQDDELTYVWGFDCDEKHRMDRMIETDTIHHHECPLIDNGLTKADCHGILKYLGIKRPEFYDLGFPNNNCIGCLKAGMGTWNLVRKHFPDVFNERAKLEREIGHSCLRKYFLDELPEDAGRIPKPISEVLTIQGMIAINKMLEMQGEKNGKM